MVSLDSPIQKKKAREIIEKYLPKPNIRKITRFHRNQEPKGGREEPTGAKNTHWILHWTCLGLNLGFFIHILLYFFFPLQINYFIGAKKILSVQFNEFSLNELMSEINTLNNK
jgi:hypothetical protein